MPPIDLQQIEKLVDSTRLVETLSQLVNTPSPTGEELELAKTVADMFNENDIDAQIIKHGEKQASVCANIKGKSPGDATNMLLYAPLDTLTSNNPEEDLPWVGAEFRADLQAKAQLIDNHLIGLGAHNPKGHAACVIEAAKIIKNLGSPINGDLYIGLGAGGMPTHSREGLAENTGHGVGCAELLKQLPKISGAIIAKSGTSVTWEEVGFVWLEVTVKGTHTYVGSRHLMPYSNAISNASKLVIALEEWFAERALELSTDSVEPQGVISYFESGWKRMPAFTPACAKFLIDLRFGPNQNAEEVIAKFGEKLTALNAELEIEASFECTQIIEASRTDNSDPIIQTTIKSWEAIHGKKHEPFNAMSGATDANIIRQHGIPTARIGLPKASLPEMDFALGMNAVAIDALVELTKLLLLSTIEFLNHPLATKSRLGGSN